MKILFILSNPSIGGTETFILSIIPELKELNVEVHILNIWKDAKLKEKAYQAKTPYFECSADCRRITLSNIRSMLNLINKNNYDVLIGFGIRVNLTLKLLNIITRKPLVIGLRGLDLWRKWYHCWPDRLTDFLVDCYVPNSDAVASIRKSREKTKDAKIVVIKNGIDVRYFVKQKSANRNKYQLPEDKILILTIANFRHQKGYDFLIDTIDRYKKSFTNCLFVWVGGGELEEYYKEKIKCLQLDGLIKMFKPVESVRELLSISDIFVLPSKEEGMPRCLLEAMSTSLPCIATSVGGIPEVIQENSVGRLVEYGNSERLYNELIELISSERLRMQMGQMARQKVESEFDIKKIAKDYLTLFSKLKKR